MAGQNKGLSSKGGNRLILDWHEWLARAFGHEVGGSQPPHAERASSPLSPGASAQHGAAQTGDAQTGDAQTADAQAADAQLGDGQAAPDAAGPTISTDLDDYAPGSTAVVTMDGVETGATVRFEIDHVNDPGADGTWGTLDDVTYQRGGEGHDPWFVTDGGEGDLDGAADGSIQTSWYVNPDDSLDERFLLTGHVIDSGADGAFGTADDSDTGTVASNTFTDSGGDYSIDFSVGDPSQYNKKRPSEFTVFPVGRANEPIPGAADASAKESLSPTELALGQIVPFEVEISTKGSATFTGEMEFVISWSTETSNGTPFGYDENFGLVAAFVDGLDGGTTDTSSTVSGFSWFYDAAAGEFVGTIRVSNMDPNSVSVVELWVVLDPTIPAGTSGNVPARLVSAREIGTDDRITTGAQTVPLLKVAEFITGSTDLSIVVSDEPNDASPSAADDPDPLVRAGDQVTYTIFAANQSADTVANGVIISDVLDANVDFVSVTVNGQEVSGVYDSTTHRVTIDLGFLERADGATDFDSNTATVLLTVRVKDGVAPGTTLTNTATITSLTSEGSSADNTNTETTVLSANAAPDAANDTGSVAEDATLTVAAGAGLLANDSDPDGQSLSVTQFTVGGVTRQAGQSATTAAGSLTINADGSYVFVPVVNFNGPAPVATYTVTDPFGGTATATLSLTVTPLNDAPVAGDDSAATDEDTAVTIAVLGNDSDVDGDPLTVTAVGGATGGTAVLNADGTVTFTPDADFTGTAGFSYTVSDGRGGTDTAAVTVAVAPLNDAPVAGDDSAATDEDTAVTIAVLGNDSDVDGDALTVTAVSGATGGTAVLNADGTVTFTPDADFTGTAGFSYTVSDGRGGTDTAAVTVAVAPLNDAPVAGDDSAATDEDTAVTIAVLGNDSDVDGDALTVTAVGGATGGTAVLNADGTVTFTPDADFTGTAGFSYTVSDGRGGTDTAAVSVAVAPLNDAPVAGDDSAATDEDTAVTIAVLGNDSDVDGDPLTVTAVGGATGGTAVLNADGTVTFTPDADFTGTAGFSYTVSDGRGGTDTAGVTIDVAPLNDAPVAGDDSAATDEDTAVTIAVLGNDSDVDGDLLTVTAVGGATGGTAVLNADGTVTFTPDADFTGTAGFSYTVSDGRGGTDTAAVSVAVAPLNDAPVAGDDSAATDEDTAVTIAVLGNDSDVDGDPLTVTAVGGATGGTAVLNADGTVTFTPDADFTGTAGFSYTVSDGQGGTDTAAVSVAVAPLNDAPVAGDDSAATDEDTAVTIAVLGNDSDVDGDALTVTAVGGATGGTAVLNADGTVTFTPDADFTGTAGFSYTVSDGRGGTDTAAVSVAVAPLNDAPVARDDSASSEADGTVEIVVTLNDSDADGDDLEILSVDTTGVLGTVTVVDGDRLLYDPNGAFDGLGQGDTAVESFTYTVSDGNGGTSTATVTVTIGGVNDAPVAVGDAVSTRQGRSLTFDVLANDTDPNGDVLAITSNTDPANGTLTLNADGTFTYAPVSSFFGIDSFQYTIEDGRGGTSTATASITVERNLAPRIPEPVVFFAPENGLTAARLQALDPEGDAVTYSIVGGLDAGLFTIDGKTGVLTFIIAPDFEIPIDANLDNRYIVRVGLQDEFNSISQTVTVNVTDVADTPNRVPTILSNGGLDMRLPLLVNRKGMILDLDAMDLDGDSLVFRLFGEDAGKFTMDTATGELTLPTPLTDPRGSFDGDFVYELDVLVEDGHGGTATISVDYVLFTAG